MSINLYSDDDYYNCPMATQLEHPPAHSPLLKYLDSITTPPESAFIKSLIKNYEPLTLQEMKQFVSRKYKRLNKERWETFNKTILVNLVFHYCKVNDIDITKQRMELSLWQYMASLLNVQTSLLIKKWVSMLRANRKLDWDDKEVIILSEEASKSDFKSWGGIAIKIYQESGHSILRSEKCIKTQWRKMTTPKGKKEWAPLEEAMIFCLFEANKYTYSSGTKMFDDRSQWDLRNKYYQRYVKNRGKKEPSDEEIKNRLLIAIRLSQRIKEEEGTLGKTKEQQELTKDIFSFGVEKYLM